MSPAATKSKLIKGATGDWEVVIGMEVHAQVTSQAKLFSGASTAFGGEPNSHVSLVDAAMPGMLPVINEECIKQAIRTWLGLNARINLKSVFDRKNYFYPDLPQGYQISQFKSPIVGAGEVVVDMPDATSVKVGIERLHLEQDAGKSLHDRHPTLSFVDLNRSGVALMQAYVDELKAHPPELPDAKKQRFAGDYGLSAYDADVLVAERATADFFEAVARGRDAKAAANWVINELAGRLNKEGSDIAAAPISPAQLGAILDLIAAGTISGKIAKDLFEICWNEGGDPHAIVEARGMKQVVDQSVIEKLVDEIIGQNPDKVEQAKAKPTGIGWFVGQVMKASGGKANPQAVNALLKSKLGI